MDHIDQVDLMDLAEDLGCFSANEEQSFTFKPSSGSHSDGNGEANSSFGRNKRHGNSDSKQHSHGLTFSDREIDVNSNLEGNIVCKKKRSKKKRLAADQCSGSYHR
mmetsp:Transcript_5141/g.6307  ORF Transcript_5141/g.6307 Transcript_5141/m.6307 type:complete len:106 (+) Transcript_5141:1115-1432(+)